METVSFMFGVDIYLFFLLFYHLSKFTCKSKIFNIHVENTDPSADLSTRNALFEADLKIWLFLHEYWMNSGWVGISTHDSIWKEIECLKFEIYTSQLSHSCPSHLSSYTFNKVAGLRQQFIYSSSFSYFFCKLTG